MRLNMNWKKTISPDDAPSGLWLRMAVEHEKEQMKRLITHAPKLCAHS